MTLKAKHYAEIHGSTVANEMINELFSAEDQAEAVRLIKSSLLAAFNVNDKLGSAVAGGFAVAIVNVLERGRDAIRADRNTN